MTDSYLYFLVALLPIAGIMVVSQANPYHALVIRGILGAIAAMIYAVLGAADVALTEALVGNMLAITLYAVAVRSSLVMRLGILQNEADSEPPLWAQLTHDLRTVLKKRHLRLEWVPYENLQSLQRALLDREVHGICEVRSDSNEAAPHLITLRVQRLHEILMNELPPKITHFSYLDVSQSTQLEFPVANGKTTDLEESHP
jgi:putative multicomponent Na+:H+ antiporter subunit B